MLFQETQGKQLFCMVGYSFLFLTHVHLKTLPVWTKTTHHINSQNVLSVNWSSIDFFTSVWKNHVNWVLWDTLTIRGFASTGLIGLPRVQLGRQRAKVFYTCLLVPYCLWELCAHFQPAFLHLVILRLGLCSPQFFASWVPVGGKKREGWRREKGFAPTCLLLVSGSFWFGLLLPLCSNRGSFH
jgi:hypothetical protein